MQRLYRSWFAERFHDFSSSEARWQKECAPISALVLCVANAYALPHYTG